MAELFSVDLKIYATLYVVADNEDEAREAAKELAGCGLELPDGYVGDGLEIYGGTYNADMPENSLSPAVTVAPLAEQDFATIEHVETLDEEDEEDED